MGRSATLQTMVSNQPPPPPTSLVFNSVLNIISKLTPLQGHLVLQCCSLNKLLNLPRSRRILEFLHFAKVCTIEGFLNCWQPTKITSRKWVSSPNYGNYIANTKRDPQGKTTTCSDVNFKYDTSRERSLEATKKVCHQPSLPISVDKLHANVSAPVGLPLRS